MKELQPSQCLEFFGELITLLSTNRHFERVFHYVVDRIVRLYHCRTCAIVLIDGETEFLNIENCFGISRTYCKEFRKLFVPMGERPQMAAGALPKESFVQAINDILLKETVAQN